MTATAADVLEWNGTNADLTEAEQASLERVLAAVESNAGETHALPAEPTEGQQAAWDLAITMQTARVWARRSTPEGVMSFAESGVIRVGSFDADVVKLLAPFAVWAFA